jgi:AcrR family transcriptional regulator
VTRGASKGESTRQAIVERATELAAVIGLEGLSIGRLAEELELSKSGLFAHFGSKEALQVQVIEEAARQFVQEVMVKALTKPRGEPRVRAFFESWLRWGERPGGCVFVAATAELDDRPGPARDALVKTMRDWLDALATAARIAMDEGHFRKDLDPVQFAHELYSLMLGHHFFARFLRDAKALTRTKKGFEALVAAARHV